LYNFYQSTGKLSQFLVALAADSFILHSTFFERPHDMIVPTCRRPRRPAVDLHRRLWLRGLENRIVPATYYVDRLDDAATSDPNDPFTGSLRYVVEKANEGPGCDDVIIIKMGTIQLLSPLEVKDEIIIDPYGASESILDFSQIDYTMHKNALIIDDCNPLTSMHVSFEAVSIIGGQAPQGGAIFVQNEDLVIKRCVISGNQATAGQGGAIYFAGGIGAKLTIIDSTISGNAAAGRGGGVYIKGNVTTVIQNSTISGNAAQGQGGGIALSGDATIEISNTTITKNASFSGQGGGGIARLNGLGTVSLQSTIVAQNNAAVAPDLAFDMPTIVNSNNSLIGVADQGKFTLNGTPNFAGSATVPLNPLLGNLVDNGGETKTHAPLPGSLAINNGNNNSGLNFDQRGPSFSRVVNGLADIGAFEVSTIPYAKSKRSDVTTAGATSFDVDVVYTDPEGGAIDISTIGLDDISVIRPDGIVINPVSFKIANPTNGSPRLVTYTFTSPGGSWDARDNGTYSVSMLAGKVFDTDTMPNAVPAGPLGDFAVTIAAGKVVNAINDEAMDTDGLVSLREAILSTPGGVITFDKTVFAAPQAIKLVLGELAIAAPITIVGLETARVTIDAQSASRIFRIDGPGSNMRVNLRNLTMVQGATAQRGGAVVSPDEYVQLFQCTIANNQATLDGGGIAMTGGTLVIDTCTIANNHTDSAGGGIFNLGGTAKISVVNSTISGNTADGQGAGIYSLYMNQPDAIVVSNSTISGNVAFRGGGIFLRDFTGGCLIRNSTITANISNAPMGSGDARGGGLFASGFGSTFEVQSSIVAGNFGADGKPDWNHDVGTQTVVGNDNIIGADEANDNFTFSGTSTGNQTGTVAMPFDPLINPLANNGGPTPTHSLKAMSPALDNGNTSTGGLIYDQRGPNFFRIRGGRADVGAFEDQAGPAPPRIVNVEINDGVIQRSIVTSIKVTLDQIVNFSPGVAAAFQLVRQSDGAVVILNSTSPATGSTATLTFVGGAVEFGSLADGRYTLTAMSNLISNAAGRLDGNGDGFISMCDDFKVVGTPTSGPKLYRIFGDVNADGVVSAFDFNELRLVYGTMGPSAFDFNTDNFTGADDFNQFRLRYGMTV